MRSRFTPASLSLPSICLALLLCQLATAQERSSPDPSLQKSSPAVLNAFRPVVAKPTQSTVRVQCGGKDVALGTVIGPDGWVLTKASELKSAAVCRLRDGRTLEARLVGVHEPYDLALLKIDAVGLTPVDWANKTATVGTWVAAAGLEDVPVAVGVVSVAARKVTARDLPIAVNSSGGYLGIDLSDALEAGVRITKVTPESPAASAGLKAEDVILSLAGQPTQDTESLQNAIGQHKPGEVVEIRVRREGQEMDLKATLGRRPGGRGGRGDFQNRMGSSLSERRNGFPKILQHDAVLRPSDCGGPLVALDGKVIGINVARAGRTESYAAPTEDVLPLLYDLMSGKLAPKPSAASTTLSPEEKAEQARAAVQQAEAEKTAIDKKLAEAKAALEKADAEAKAAREPGSR